MLLPRRAFNGYGLPVTSCRQQLPPWRQEVPAPPLQAFPTLPSLPSQFSSTARECLSTPAWHSPCPGQVARPCKKTRHHFSPRLDEPRRDPTDLLHGKYLRRT